ncbi:DUF1254 domain-containing protein [Sphingomonas aracearum]|uniref:DUF1254 domain-containing protein n=1 Tax=Sphingomonas aracearum TaxID=2283317 RepID=A0A369W3T4_9SPHN|nr:DUF1254 domain-containing protein [Sphingomonas aracearum]RDE06721.1 DUF1254 domain-containing protein [Sphingomonas aracearum]
MRGWLGPIMAGLVVAALAYALVIARTPKFLMGRAVERVAAAGGMNRFTHAPLATDRSRTIVRPSPDLAYSSCPFDVSAGPLLIEATPVAAPYWSLSVFDSDTTVAFVRNDASGARRRVKVAVLADGQQAPAGYEPVRLMGHRGIALIRILVPDRQLFAQIDRERRQATCRVAG